jgi:hypothetical protein
LKTRRWQDYRTFARGLAKRNMARAHMVDVQPSWSMRSLRRHCEPRRRGGVDLADSKATMRRQYTVGYCHNTTYHDGCSWHKDEMLYTSCGGSVEPGPMHGPHRQCGSCPPDSPSLELQLQLDYSGTHACAKSSARSTLSPTPCQASGTTAPQTGHEPRRLAV